MKTLTEILRTLAKSDYYQSLYSVSKESSLRIFYNDIDLSDIQFTFLRYLNFYSNIFMDIATGEVSERVIENEIYEDSYTLYKNKTRHNERSDMKNKSMPNQRKDSKELSSSSWLFKRK